MCVVYMRRTMVNVHAIAQGQSQYARRTRLLYDDSRYTCDDDNFMLSGDVENKKKEKRRRVRESGIQILVSTRKAT